MNRSSLSLFVTIALAGAAMVACATTTDSASDTDEATGRTQQALRNCPDGVCDPPPPKTPRPPPTSTTPPPAPTPTTPPTWTLPTVPVGNLPVLQEDYVMRCDAPGQRIVDAIMVGNVRVETPGDYHCWNVGPCPPTTSAVAHLAGPSSSSSGDPPPEPPVCNGYSLVSQNYCSTGYTMSCSIVSGTCSCRR